MLLTQAWAKLDRPTAPNLDEGCGNTLLARHGLRSFMVISAIGEDAQ
jgi:hypothetical protein